MYVHVIVSDFSVHAFKLLPSNFFSGCRRHWHPTRHGQLQVDAMPAHQSQQILYGSNWKKSGSRNYPELGPEGEGTVQS